MDPTPVPKVVVFSGHRSISPADVRKIWAGVKLVVENPTVDEVWVGGARGTDNEVLKAALHYRGEKKSPKIVVVVPDTVQKQPRECWEWIRRADQVIELENEITADNKFSAFRKRNEFMLDHGKVLVVFWNGDKKTGTGQSVNYARKTNLPVKHIPVGT